MIFEMAINRFSAKKSAHEVLYVLVWAVAPQKVVTGKPYSEVLEPSGTGAGVVCNLPNFSARVSVVVLLLARLEISRNSVTRKNPEEEERAPLARLAGQRDGTVVWIALREKCSPSRGYSSA